MLKSRKLVAYLLAFSKRRLNTLELARDLGLILQDEQLKRFESVVSGKIIERFPDQSTSRKSKFWNRPQFLHAAETARSNDALLVVGDVVDLLSGHPLGELNTEWKSLISNFPSLHSAKHFESMREHIRIKADLDTWLFKKTHSLKRRTSPTSHAALPGKKSAARNKNSSDALAKFLAPKLREILVAEPGAGPTRVATLLNSKNVKSPTGKQWHPSSAKNLIARCQRLGII